MTTQYQAPPEACTADGQPRRIGIEIELSGLAVPELASLVAEQLGGTIEAPDIQTKARVEGTTFGTFVVELDARPVQQRTWSTRLEDLGLDAEPIRDAVVSVAREIVPVEVVTPPIPMAQLHELDPLWEAIRGAGGLGTDAAMRYAFGLHLNPDVAPSLEAQNILRHLQAYLLLEDWIAEREHVNWARRVTPYIRPFPELFRRRVLDSGYAPNLDELVADYLVHSPTRNRPLDLLPLFVHLRPDCMDGREVDDAHLVKPRPTFHYRLPNCEIDHAGWTPAAAFNRWLDVERLAGQRGRLASMAAAYRELRQLPWRLQRREWTERVQQRWLPIPESS